MLNFTYFPHEVKANQTRNSRSPLTLSKTTNSHRMLATLQNTVLSFIHVFSTLLYWNIGEGDIDCHDRAEGEECICWRPGSVLQGRKILVVVCFHTQSALTNTHKSRPSKQAKAIQQTNKQIHIRYFTYTYSHESTKVWWRATLWLWLSVRRRKQKFEFFKSVFGGTPSGTDRSNQ